MLLKRTIWQKPGQYQIPTTQPTTLSLTQPPNLCLTPNHEYQNASTTVRNWHQTRPYCRIIADQYSSTDPEIASIRSWSSECGAQSRHSFLRISIKIPWTSCGLWWLYHTYADGSKDCRAVASAVVAKSAVKVKRLPYNATIFTAESEVILVTLNIGYVSVTKNVLILSESLSCQKSNKTRKFENVQIVRICQRIRNNMISSGFQITLRWLPEEVFTMFFSLGWNVFELGAQCCSTFVGHFNDNTLVKSFKGWFSIAW